MFNLIKTLGCFFLGLLTFYCSGVMAQLATYSPFQIMQGTGADSFFLEDPGAAALFPALPTSKRKFTQISYFRTMEINNWQQLAFTAKRQLQATDALVQFSFEKQAASVLTSQLALQFSRLLQPDYAVGLQLGVLQRLHQQYRSIWIPFAQLGCWTNFSPNFFQAVSIGFSLREVAAEWNQRPYELLARSCSSIRMGQTVSFQLHVEKLTGRPFFWQLGLAMVAAKSTLVRLSYSPKPQWWVMHFLFPIRIMSLKVSLGFQPSLGTVSGIAATWTD